MCFLRDEFVELFRRFHRSSANIEVHDKPYVVNRFSEDLHWQTYVAYKVSIDGVFLIWFSTWWFQPIWKILVKLDHFRNFRGENKKYIETTT